jgi:hypothetical protein
VWEAGPSCAVAGAGVGAPAGGAAPAHETAADIDSKAHTAKRRGHDAQKKNRPVVLMIFTSQNRNPSRTPGDGLGA